MVAPLDAPLGVVAVVSLLDAVLITADVVVVVFVGAWVVVEVVVPLTALLVLALLFVWPVVVFVEPFEEEVVVAVVAFELDAAIPLFA